MFPAEEHCRIGIFMQSIQSAAALAALRTRVAQRTETREAF